MKRLLLVLLVLGIPFVGWAKKLIRVGWVDPLDPDHIRVILNGIDSKTLEPLSISDYDYIGIEISGEGLERPIEIEFEGGNSVGEFPATLTPARRSDVPLYVVFVAAVHGYVSRDLEAGIRGAVMKAAKFLKKNTFVSVILYNDTINVLRSSKGDLKLEDMNAEGRLLRELRWGKVKSKEFFYSSKTLKGLKGMRFHTVGMFPRLWGIRESLMEKARERGHYPIDAYEVGKHTERFAAGAVEAAARLILTFAPVEAEKVIFLLSDGRDGYLEAQGIFFKKVQGMCQGMQKHVRGKEYDLGRILECISRHIGELSRPRYEARVRYLERLIVLLQALNVRVFVVSYPGTRRLDGELLRFLAVKTGGTFRSASNLELQGFVSRVGETARELSEEALVTLQKGLKEGFWYSLVAYAEKESGEQLEARHGYWVFVPQTPFFLKRLYNKIEDFAISKVGDTWGPPLTWGMIVVGILLLILMVLTFVRIGKAIKKVKDAKKLQKAARAKLRRPGR